MLIYHTARKYRQLRRKVYCLYPKLLVENNQNENHVSLRKTQENGDWFKLSSVDYWMADIAVADNSLVEPFAGRMHKIGSCKNLEIKFTPQF